MLIAKQIPINSRSTSSSASPTASPKSSLVLKTISRDLLYRLTFVISALTVRDAIGKKPRIGAYIDGGLSSIQDLLSDGNPRGLSSSPYSDLTPRLLRIKRYEAELMLLKVELLLMRSQFAACKKVRYNPLLHQARSS